MLFTPKAVTYMRRSGTGLATLPHMTGSPTVSSSASPWDSDDMFSYPPPFTTEKVKYKDFPPTELSVYHIPRTIGDDVNMAKLAMSCGFDGVEVHGANGYLPEQFLYSNIIT